MQRVGFVGLGRLEGQGEAYQASLRPSPCLNPRAETERPRCKPTINGGLSRPGAKIERSAVVRGTRRIGPNGQADIGGQETNHRGLRGSAWGGLLRRALGKRAVPLPLLEK